MEANYIIQVFEAAGYSCVGKDSKRRLINFYHSKAETFIEFPFSEKTSLLEVIGTITKNAYEQGFTTAQKRTRIEMKSAIGLM